MKILSEVSIEFLKRKRDRATFIQDDFSNPSSSLENKKPRFQLPPKNQESYEDDSL
jgi:hypothetical protein